MRDPSFNNESNKNAKVPLSIVLWDLLNDENGNLCSALSNYRIEVPKLVLRMDESTEVHRQKTISDRILFFNIHANFH